jgi:glycosyltransferase involved in cell wall biosynthesis
MRFRIENDFLGQNYMASAPLTTVLIDTYNYGRFIEQAIDSVLLQDFPPEQLELIVVDDGSTDDTAARVERYGSRIKYLKKQNGGQASAFNLGIANASGEFIVLLDADDYFLPGKLRRVLEAFQSHRDVGMVYHRLPQLHNGGVMVPAAEFEALSGFLPADARKLAKYRAHQTSCLAFRRSTLQEIFPIPESMRIQADAYPELVAVLLTPVLAIEEDLAVYRIHGENLCAGDFQAVNAEEATRLVVSSNTVRREVQQWIRAHRQRIASVNTRRLLDGMVLLAIEQQFRFETPGRFRYFAFLMRQNYALGPTQAWPYTTIKYVVALAALLVGYKKYLVIHAWCGKTLNALRPLIHPQ